MKDVSETNAALRRLLQNVCDIQIHPIPLDRLRLVTFVDSSLGNCPDGGSQNAHMVCAADKSINEGKEADISILTYKSHKMARVASATLMVEANAMSEGLAESEWVCTWIGLARDYTYDMRKRNLLNREFEVQTVMSDTNKDLHSVVTDAK